MSGHSPIREDKTCLNCRHVVEKRFCPNCGQENTDSRKTFHHLFVHFFEDLTHYENAFWKTIRHLLFKPGRLTKEYLSGKRLSYLAPVRLYIFISFVTFLTLGLLPDTEEDEETTSPKSKKELADLRQKINDSISQNVSKGLVKAGQNDTLVKLNHGRIGNFSIRDTDTLDDGRDIDGFGSFNSVKEFDSIQNSLPKEKKLKGVRYSLERCLADMREKTDKDDFTEKFTEGFMHNVPKALFLYMPFFAFWLWIFHNKKRWYYFDHGIFTLHYFSFLLVTMLIMDCISTAADFIDFTPLSYLVGFMWFALYCWWFFYFFRSHSRFYAESKAVSRLKSLSLYFINLFFISIFSVLLMFYTIIYMH